ncbi:hypothetical protein KD050_16535 [Psychrobacillus sp. INOP01]|uniref:hypothetical protein n=1 Tax=Psychrobacillus sp. INOP01 TaxID=2829187 RepID=UPI001BA99C54|nr:hypothetical protein [Psychrobacillus sp. INOP01]QUG40880.1 hypothetical protein KD050_16535 [Psychrobacillus sp. INOP01]
MGYILPMQSIQTEVYANRMIGNDRNFAYIDNIQNAKFKSVFDDHLEEQEQLLEEEEEQLLESERPSTQPLFKGFIHPNPVNLSPRIAEINGKGNSVNLYV